MADIEHLPTRRYCRDEPLPCDSEDCSNQAVMVVRARAPKPITGLYCEECGRVLLLTVGKLLCRLDDAGDIDVLRRQLAEARSEKLGLHERLRQTERFYAERLKEIEFEAERAGIGDRVSAILERGAPSEDEPPAFEKLLQAAERRASAAELRARSAEARVAELEAELRRRG